MNELGTSLVIAVGNRCKRSKASSLKPQASKESRSSTVTAESAQLTAA
jgi:hypothetical protein